MINTPAIGWPTYYVVRTSDSTGVLVHGMMFISLKTILVQYQHNIQVINAEKWRYDGCFAGIKLASSLRTVLSPSLEIQLIVWSTCRWRKINMHE